MGIKIIYARSNRKTNFTNTILLHSFPRNFAEPRPSGSGLSGNYDPIGSVFAPCIIPWPLYLFSIAPVSSLQIHILAPFIALVNACFCPLYLFSKSLLLTCIYLKFVYSCHLYIPNISLSLSLSLFYSSHLLPPVSSLQITIAASCIDFKNTYYSSLYLLYKSILLTPCQTCKMSRPSQPAVV